MFASTKQLLKAGGVDFAIVAVPPDLRLPLAVLILGMGYRGGVRETASSGVFSLAAALQA